MQKRKMALLLLFGTIISTVSGVVSAVVTIKVERLLTASSEASVDAEDDSKPVVHRVRTAKRPLYLER